jgi:hypothetical protein
MNKNIPIYKAVLEDEETGMYTISLVTNPAVQSDFLYFNEQRMPLHFKVENEEKRVVTGVIMRCDYPIYRIGMSGMEYYLTFDKQTIEKMAEKWLKSGFQSNVNLQHNPDAYVEDVLLKEVFFKDVNRGINPMGFEDIEDGSLFGTYHILNDEVWASVKSGEFKGFSLEGYFNVVEVEQDQEEAEYNEIMALIDKIEKIKNK